MQNEPVNPGAAANRKLRPGALAVSGALSLLGALAILLLLAGHVSEARLASAWSLTLFLSGVWAGVLGANSPFIHGLVAGIPALALGLLIASPLPAQFVIIAWFLAPSAALVSAALMRYRRNRRKVDR